MGRLCFGRRAGEAIVISVPGMKPIRVVVKPRNSSMTGVEIEAPREVQIDREEVWLEKIGQQQ